MGVARAALVACTLVAVARTAHADVDWAKGVVTAKGLGVADRHAPSPASAREPARRMAEDAARAKLAAQVPDLPLAGGKTVKSKLADKAIKARIDRAIATAITLESTPQTDGSWEVTLAVPIEAVRIALAGPRTLAGSDNDPPVIVVEGVTAKPAVGITVGDVAAATLWVTAVPDWAASAPRVKAAGAKAGSIQLTAKQGGPSTVFVLVK